MEKKNNSNDSAVSKLLIDRPSDFKFHAAYEAYSQAWEKASSKDVKEKLNEYISSLAKGEIDYDHFYREINKHRMKTEIKYRGFPRTRIKTQRKKEWRRKEAKSLKDSRYKKK